MVIVETSVWVDYVRQVENAQTSWIRQNLNATIGIVDLTLCEVLQGATTDAEFRFLREMLLRCPVVSTGGAAVALRAAENYRALRSRGLTVRTTIDCVIATCCIDLGHTLLHRDRDFDAFERHLNLRVLHPERLN